jgi:hypothetical protein
MTGLFLCAAVALAMFTTGGIVTAIEPAPAWAVALLMTSA